MISRAGGSGGPDPFAAPGDAQNVALNSPDNIEKERDFERIYKVLTREFQQMDTSGDGTLDKGELMDFFMKKVKEQGGEE